MKAKEGQGDIITVVMIIFLIVLAIAVTGIFVMKSINNAKIRSEVATSCSQVSISPTKCNYLQSYPNLAYVAVSRKAGSGNVVVNNMSLIFEKSGSTEVRSTSLIPTPLETRYYDLSNSAQVSGGLLSSVALPDSVQVSPFVANNGAGSYPCPISPVKVACSLTPTYYANFTSSSSGNISVPDVAIPISNGFALSFWYKTTGFSGTVYLFTAKSGAIPLAQAYAVSPNIWGFLSTSGGSQTVSVGAPSSNIWHNYLLNYNGSSLSLYSDGVQVGVPNLLTGSVNSATVSLVMGSGAYSGAIDELRIYNRGLNAAEIAQLNSSLRVANPSVVSNGLIAYYSFDEGSGNAIDSINSYNGQFLGSAQRIAG